RDFCRPPRIHIPTPHAAHHKNPGLNPNPSSSDRVRPVDAAGNPGPSPNTFTAATSPSGGSSLVAAYGFNEGSGTLVGDASGSGNAGAVADGTGAAAGKYGSAVAFKGGSSVVTVREAAGCGS